MELPAPTNAPLQLPEYQFHAAPAPREPPDRVKVVVPPQVGFGLAAALDGAVDEVIIVIVTEAQDVVLQVPDALTQ